MTADIDFDFEGDEPQGGSAAPNVGKLREAHKKATKRAGDAEARAEQAERKLAFAEAGLDLSDKKVKYFIAGYDGELKADDIKKAAIDDGFLPDPTAKAEETTETTEQNQPHPDQAGFQQMEEATAGAGQQASGVDLRKGMMEIYERGGTADDVASFLSQHGHPVSSQGD